MVTPDKKTPVVESLFNKAGALKIWIFIKKGIPTQVFSCEYCDIFKNSFLVELFLFIILLRDDRILWMFLGNRLVSYFLYYCFVFLHNSSVRIGNPQLFFTCFYTQISSKHNFRTHFNVGSSTILIESLKTRNNCRTLVLSLSFLNIILYFYRPLKAVLLPWLKITQPKNKSV